MEYCITRPDGCLRESKRLPRQSNAGFERGLVEFNADAAV